MSDAGVSSESQSSPAPRGRRRRHTEFWRAARFLGPYRGLVGISVVCAFFVGAIGTAGISIIAPILAVLINDGATVPQFIDRNIAERRIGAALSERTDELQVQRVSPGGPASEAGLRPGDVLIPLAVRGEAQPGASVSIQGLLHGDAALQRLASADGPVPMSVLRLDETGSAASITVTLVPRPANAAYAIVRGLAHRLPAHPVGAIAVLLGVILLMAVVANVIRFFQEHLSDRAAIGAVNDIRRKTYDHVLHVPMGYFGTAGTSDVTSRLVSDAAGLQDGFKILLGQTVQEPIKAAMALGLALWIDWRLTLAIIVFAPVMGAIIKKFGKKVRRATRAALAQSSSMLGQIDATLTGIRAVKAAGAERFERRRYAGIMRGLVEQQTRMSRYEALSTPTMETLTLVVVCLIVLLAAWLVLVDHSLEATSFFVIMACLVAMGESMRKVSKLNNVLQRSNAAAARLFETLDLPAEDNRAVRRSRGIGHRPALAPLSRQIAFEHVTFTYPRAPEPAVRDLSLVVPRGTSVAVVGRNGSGKTTLLALLCRFYDPDSGRVTIDGVDIAGVSLNSLRRQISLVTQDSVIFPGTIAHNIAYGLPRASRAQIESAARKAFAHDFIIAKPQGYDTPLDGLGAQLSGGQKQRLCIARAILRNAPILILDEATSQVDAESEHLIQQAIESVMKENAAGASGRPTTFVIAHRFSTILSADVIVVMDQGRIVGSGKHRELMSTCPTYRQLYERQFAPADNSGAAESAATPVSA